MFTGIVEETGVLREITKGAVSAQVRVGCRKALEGTKIGDSIAVNGICLTVTSMAGDSFTSWRRPCAAAACLSLPCRGL